MNFYIFCFRFQWTSGDFISRVSGYRSRNISSKQLRVFINDSDRMFLRLHQHYSIATCIAMSFIIKTFDFWETESFLRTSQVGATREKLFRCCCCCHRETPEEEKVFQKIYVNFSCLRLRKKTARTFMSDAKGGFTILMSQKQSIFRQSHSTKVKPSEVKRSLIHS